MSKGKRINWRLWSGMILTAFLFFVAIFGPAMAPYDDDYEEKIVYVQTDQGSELKAAPFPPSSKHWFGTDKYGHDLLTLLLHGAKYTVFTAIIVALGRLIIGGAAGFFGGMHRAEKVKGKNQFGVLGAFPAFLIVYFVMLGMNINSSLSPWQLTVFQAALMTAVGIPGVYSVIQSKTIELRKKLFVTAASSLGGGTSHLIWKHLFPHLKGNLIALFVNEIIATLALIGQLGIFNLFLGGTIKQFVPVIYFSKTHEWAGLVGQMRGFVFNAQWILFFPLCAFILAILSFYLLSRGLELRERAAMHKFPHI
ncbi:MAG TPA: ABC transporter permease subunit [Bacillales bacterium]